jgi:hypothetical protein
VSTNREEIETAIRKALALSQEGLIYSNRYLNELKQRRPDIFRELFG